MPFTNLLGAWLLAAFHGWSGFGLFLQILQRGFYAGAQTLRVCQCLIELAKQVLDDLVGISVVGWQGRMNAPTVANGKRRSILLVATAA